MEGRLGAPRLKGNFCDSFKERDMKGVWDGVGRGRGTLPLACLSPPAHPNLVLPFLDTFILIYARLMPTLPGKHDDRTAKGKISEHVARREARRSEAVVVVSGKPWHPMLLSLTEVPASSHALLRTSHG